MSELPSIREATVEDLPEAGRLGALLVEVHHRLDPQRFLAAGSDTAARYAAFLGTRLDLPNVVLLVAADPGRVIGYAYGVLEGYDYMALRGPAGVLHDLIVDPAHRHRGAGRLLLHSALAEFRARNASRVVLSTADRNDAAWRFFLAAGFRRTMVELTCELDSPCE